MKERLWTKNFIFLTVGSLGAGFLVSFFLNTLPVYAEQMTGTAVYAGLVTTCYTLAALVSRPIIGNLCVKMDSWKLILIGLVLMTLSCYAYSFATTIGILIIIRIIHGIGFGIKSTASGVLVAEIIPQSRFAEGIGMFGLYMPVSNAVGPAFGLWIAGKGSFHTLFVIAGIVGLISLILIGLAKPKRKTEETKDAAEDGDPVRGQTKRDDLPRAFLGFEFGVVFPSLVLMLTYFGYSAIVSFVALYAISIGIDGIGWFFTIGAIALFVVRFLFAKLVKKYGYHSFVLAHLLAFAAVLFLIPHLHNVYALYVTAVFYGGALGIMPMAVNAQVLERCSKKRSGTAMAAYTSSMDLGIGIGSMVMGVVVDSAGFTAAFSLAASMCIAAFILYACTVMRDHEEYIRRMKLVNAG